MSDLSSEFSESFKSPLFTVMVGPEKKSYGLHKDILSRKSPYFKTLLSFPGVESTTDSVHLDSAVDTVQAFDMLVQFLYRDTYKPTPHLSDSWKAQIHAEVYVLAERLLMPDLKDLALESMARTLQNLYGSQNIDVYDPVQKTWGLETVSVVDLEGVACLVATVYTNLEAEPKEEEKEDSDSSKKPEKTKKSATTKTKDKMKRIIARYCASVLDVIRDTSPDMVSELVDEHPEFAVDLIMELSPRTTEVRATETAYL
ncbi:hypothetical protein EDC01DRAFT_635756 [Geopyxis carbonaria]|nr:hypothetical protein EDC01DRAFT_635756 [Geopyxis carbonaria]